MGSGTVFSHRFTTLIGTKITLIQNLKILTSSYDGPGLGRTLLTVGTSIRRNAGLSSTVHGRPTYFSGLCITLIRTNRINNMLSRILGQLTGLLRSLGHLRGRVGSTLACPIIINVLTIAVFITVAVFLLPVFTSVFRRVSTRLPTFARVVLLVDTFLQGPLG